MLKNKSKRRSKAWEEAEKNFAEMKQKIKKAYSSQNKLNIELKNSVGKLVRIPIDMVHLDKNIRKTVDTSSNGFKALLESIKNDGIQQNIVVELQECGSIITLTCVSGHRRIIAAKMLDSIKHVPALIKIYNSDDHRLELALAENLLREDLHALEIAEGYKNLMQKGWSIEKICTKFGKAERTIQYYIRMSSWPLDAKKFIKENYKKFSTRILMHKIACRRFKSDSELMSVLKKTAEISKFDKRNKSIRKAYMLKKVNQFFKEKRYKTATKKAIYDTLEYLNLI